MRDVASLELRSIQCSYKLKCLLVHMYLTVLVDAGVILSSITFLQRICLKQQSEREGLRRKHPPQSGERSSEKSRTARAPESWEPSAATRRHRASDTRSGPRETTQSQRKRRSKFPGILGTESVGPIGQSERSERPGSSSEVNSCQDRQGSRRAET